MLKKDIVSAIKQRKFQRLITEEPPQQQQYHSTRHNSQPSNVESEYVASRSIIVDPKFLTEIEYSVDNPGPVIPKPSVRASLKDKDKGLTQNFYEAVNKQETRNSVVTEAWSPNKKSPRRGLKGELTLDISPLIGATSEPNSPISLPLNDDNKSIGRIKELEDNKKDEIIDETRAKISTMETDGEERMVTEIRSTNPIVTNNSRTSYIKDTIDKKFHVNMKLKKLKSGPGTGPYAFTRVLGDLSIMKKAMKSDEKKNKDSSQKNSLRQQQAQQDHMASVSSMVRKLTETKPADLQPIMKISSKLQKKVNDIFIPRGSFLSKIPMDSSFVQPKQSTLNHHWSEDEHEELAGNKNKLNESCKILELTEVPKSVLRAQHLQYDLNSAGIKGFKTIDDLPKDTLQAAENSKYYLSRVFPGFRPKSIIRRPPDYNAIFVEKLQKEASMRIRKAIRERREASMGNHSYLQTEGEDVHNNSTGAGDSTLSKRYRRGRNTDSKSTKNWSYSVSRPVMTEM